MPDLNQLVLTGADYKILADVPNAAGGFTAYQILTAQEISYDVTVEDETVYAVGTILPIAEKSNAKAYKGTLSLEMGELNAIVSLAGRNDATQLVGLTLAITAIQGAFVRVFTSVNINTEGLSVKAKDKHTPVKCDWKGLGVNNA